MLGFSKYSDTATLGRVKTLYVLISINGYQSKRSNEIKLEICETKKLIYSFSNPRQYFQMHVLFKGGLSGRMI